LNQHKLIEIDPAIQSIYSESQRDKNSPESTHLVRSLDSSFYQEELPKSHQEIMEDQFLYNQAKIMELEQSICFYYYTHEQMQEEYDTNVILIYNKRILEKEMERLNEKNQPFLKDLYQKQSKLENELI
jgi:hypothetical protein